MSCQCRVVGHDDVITDLAVVGDMCADHEETVVADPGHEATAVRSGIHGDVFADGVVGADDELGSLAAVLQVLGRKAQGSERKDRATFAQTRCGRRGRRATAGRLRRHPAKQRGFNHAIGADDDVIGNGSAGVD